MELIGLIKSKFSFLDDLRFKCKTLRKNSETEIVYIKDSFKIEIFADSCGESLDIVIEKEARRFNIRDFEFSDKDKCRAAVQALSVIGLDKKAHEISRFIYENLSKLMSI